jgi:hypothetical protein
MRSISLQRLVMTLCASLVTSGCEDLPSSGQSNASQERHSAYAQDLAKRHEDEQARRTEICLRINRELPNYSRDYVKRVVAILGTCQKALESPRFLVGTVYADASSQFDALELDFPDKRTSGAHSGLYSLLNDVHMLSGLEREYWNSNVDANIAYRMTADIDAMRTALIK